MLPRYVAIDGEVTEVVNIRPRLGGILETYTPTRNAVIVEFFGDIMPPVIHVECMNENMYPALRKAALDIYNNAVLQD